MWFPSYSKLIFGSSAPTVPIEREKGNRRGRVGSWKSQFANIGPHHSPSQPKISAQLLGKTASGEPYTILIMHPRYEKTNKQTNKQESEPRKLVALLT
jgi:hypothetical protein